MRPPEAATFLFGDALVPQSEMSDEAIEDYVKDLKEPREGFISPYATLGRGQKRPLGTDLGYEGEFECNVEEVSEIVEVLYARPWDFAKYMLSAKNEGRFVRFDATDDEYACYPRLRKKVRLLAGYGVLPELEQVLQLYSPNN